MFVWGYLFELSTGFTSVENGCRTDVRQIMLIEDRG
jgi:hypothetical protein